MLRDEEKKAIETIKDFKNLKWYEHAFDNGTEVLDEEQKQDIEIILNLIEKQSKEIEELKNGQIDFWISDKEIEERIRNKFISKDKIKAKIEELEKEQEDNRKDLYNAVNNLYFSKIDIISNRIFVNMSIKDILQSLLEEDYND